jgi:hypothetical protein
LFIPALLLPSAPLDLVLKGLLYLLGFLTTFTVSGLSCGFAVTMCCPLLLPRRLSGLLNAILDFDTALLTVPFSIESLLVAELPVLPSIFDCVLFERDADLLFVLLIPLSPLFVRSIPSKYSSSSFRLWVLPSTRFRYA